MSQDLRSVLFSAYSYVRSQETNQAISANTLDHVLQDRITSLKKGATTSVVDGKGENVGSRTSQYDDLNTLEKQIDSVVAAVQSAGDDQDKLQGIGIGEADTNQG